MTRDGGDEAFALKYGALEALLHELVGGTGSAVASRFRKLRPKFASDGLLTDTGNRVSYDLTRILAICMTYELNSLSIPQGAAVDIVVANWPEIARACLTGWAEVSGKARADGRDRSPVVRFYVDAINVSPREGSWASPKPDPIPGSPHAAVDCRPALAALTTVAEQSDQSDRLALAFADLENTFGWDALGEGDPVRLPRRTETDFFGTGPYFERARRLLAVEPGQALHRRQAARLQSILDYLEKPAPIDSWKRFIGTEAGRPRLVHMLAAWGGSLTLKSATLGEVEVLSASSLDRVAALDLIRRGEEHIASLVSQQTT